jgi:hypothetical protein
MSEFAFTICRRHICNRLVWFWFQISIFVATRHQPSALMVSGACGIPLLVHVCTYIRRIKIKCLRKLILMSLGFNVFILYLEFYNKLPTNIEKLKAAGWGYDLLIWWSLGVHSLWWNWMSKVKCDSIFVHTWIIHHGCVCVCVCVCVRARARACVRACVFVCVCV